MMSKLIGLLGVGVGVLGGDFVVSRRARYN